jgi:F-type H+-transporting ATPase subunit delta
MSSKNREGMLQDVAATFLSLKNKSEGITEVSVITAKEIKAADLSGIEAFVKSNTNAKKVLITNSVDESLIGGFKVSFDGKLYDSTVSTHLNNLKKELKLA